MENLAKMSVLVVEDSGAMIRIYRSYLSSEICDVVAVETGAEALAALKEHSPDVILLDIRLPDMDGLDILRYVKERRLPSEVVVITGFPTINLAVEAMRLGAYDFMVKPFTSDRLTVTIRNALQHRRLSCLVAASGSDFANGRFERFVGSSLVMQAVYRTIDAVAQSKATVFISGESGTGKELCAEALHRRSPRRDGPFIAVNCGAIPRDLMESELFGHMKGAFTGAVSGREGAVGSAHKGTLFLDEICEMELAAQAKLLRFLQEGVVRKVGSDKPTQVDVRIVCATNRNPQEEVEAGRFREDLYYRLHVIPISLPPLRDRGGDVVEIAEVLLHDLAHEEGKQFQRLAPEALEALRSYSWPGNVRQLHNILRTAVVLYDGEELTRQMLPPLHAGLGGGGRQVPSSIQVVPPPTVDGAVPLRPLWQVERDAIEQAISMCGGNISLAAAHLSISASTVYRKRQSWETGGEPSGVSLFQEPFLDKR